MPNNLFINNNPPKHQFLVEGMLVLPGVIGEILVMCILQLTDRHSIHSQTPPEHVYPLQQSYGTDRPYYSNVQQVSLPSFSEIFGECTVVPDSEEYLPEYISRYQSTTDNYYFSDQHS